MKQIKAFIQRNKLDSVIDAVEKQDVDGLTVIQAQGRGEGERPLLGNPSIIPDVIPDSKNPLESPIWFEEYSEEDIED